MTCRTRSLLRPSCLVLAAWMAAGIASAEETADPAGITLAGPATFATPEGSTVTVPEGHYHVGLGEGSALSLTPLGGGEPLVLAAEAARHEEAVEERIALSELGEDGSRHLLLMLPEGAMREAVGSDGEVMTRGARRLSFPQKSRKRALLSKRRNQLLRILPGRRPSKKEPRPPRPPADGRRGRTPDRPPPTPPPVEPEPKACTWRTSDIIDGRIDIDAQYSSMRKMSRGAPQSTTASAMIGAVKSGALEGIYEKGRKATADRAASLGKGYWDLIPTGQDSVCVTEPEGARPMIVFRNQLSDGAIDRTLDDSWRQCGLPTPEPPCAYVVDREKPSCPAAGTSAFIESHDACSNKIIGHDGGPPVCNRKWHLCGETDYQCIADRRNEYNACLDENYPDANEACKEEAMAACIEAAKGG